MTVACFDCFSGISGNMILGALLDAGLSLQDLKTDLAQLQVSDYRLEVSRVWRHGLAGTLVDVTVEEANVERQLPQILSIIESANLPNEVKERCGRIFARLADAEAQVHGSAAAKSHFHEVGAVDALVDVVGSVAGLYRLGVDQVYMSPLHLGTGLVNCAHGKIPVPAPATLELVRGVPVYGGDIHAELTTPTGAAVITTLASQMDFAPPMRVKSIGYGAGHRDLPIPNLLRIALGEPLGGATGQYEQDIVTVIETTVDDMNPEFYDHAMNTLFRNGALDVLLVPAQMKKNRPVAMLSVLAAPADVERVVRTIFDETTTLGVRLRQESRRKLARESVSVQTRYGPVRVKIGKLAGQVKTVSPEYEDCRQAAEEQKVPVKDVYAEASRAATDYLGQRATGRHEADKGS